MKIPFKTFSRASNLPKYADLVPSSQVRWASFTTEQAENFIAANRDSSVDHFPTVWAKDVRGATDKNLEKMIEQHSLLFRTEAPDLALRYKAHDTQSQDSLIYFLKKMARNSDNNLKAFVTGLLGQFGMANAPGFYETQSWSPNMVAFIMRAVAKDNNLWQGKAAFRYVLVSEDFLGVLVEALVTTEFAKEVGTEAASLFNILLSVMSNENYYSGESALSQMREGLIDSLVVFVGNAGIEEKAKKLVDAGLKAPDQLAKEAANLVAKALNGGSSDEPDDDGDGDTLSLYPNYKSFKADLKKITNQKGYKKRYTIYTDDVFDQSGVNAIVDGGNNNWMLNNLVSTKTGASGVEVCSLHIAQVDLDKQGAHIAYKDLVQALRSYPLLSDAEFPKSNAKIKSLSVVIPLPYSREEESAFAKIGGLTKPYLIASYGADNKALVLPFESIEDSMGSDAYFDFMFGLAAAVHVSDVKKLGVDGVYSYFNKTLQAEQIEPETPPKKERIKSQKDDVVIEEKQDEAGNTETFFHTDNSAIEQRVQELLKKQFKNHEGVFEYIIEPSKPMFDAFISALQTVVEDVPFAVESLANAYESDPENEFFTQYENLLARDENNNLYVYSTFPTVAEAQGRLTDAIIAMIEQSGVRTAVEKGESLYDELQAGTSGYIDPSSLIMSNLFWANENDPEYLSYVFAEVMELTTGTTISYTESDGTLVDLPPAVALAKSLDVLYTCFYGIDQTHDEIVDSILEIAREITFNAYFDGAAIAEQLTVMHPEVQTVVPQTIEETAKKVVAETVTQGDVVETQSGTSVVVDHDQTELEIMRQAFLDYGLTDLTELENPIRKRSFSQFAAFSIAMTGVLEAFAFGFSAAQEDAANYPDFADPRVVYLFPPKSQHTEAIQVALETLLGDFLRSMHGAANKKNKRWGSDALMESLPNVPEQIIWNSYFSEPLPRMASIDGELVDLGEYFDEQRKARLFGQAFLLLKDCTTTYEDVKGNELEVPFGQAICWTVYTCAIALAKQYADMPEDAFVTKAASVLASYVNKVPAPRVLSLIEYADAERAKQAASVDDLASDFGEELSNQLLNLFIQADSLHQTPTNSFPSQLNKNFLAQTGAENDQLVLALDFGTAFSKAVVWNRQNGDSGDIDLALGKQTQVFGQTNTNFLFPVASAIFIDDEGRIWFGPDVEESREHLTDAMREEKRSCFKLKVRFNSEHDFPDPFKVDVAKEYNPTDYEIKEWHLMVLYLSYFVDLSVSALKKQHNLDFRYLAIHYVHPCWSTQQKEKWKPFYDLLLTQAQVLADTLHGRWAEGFTVEQVFPLLEQLREDVKNPSSWLIQKDFDEPVAASADILTFLDQKESTAQLEKDRRHLLLVVDAGAGTTDFGLFVIRESPFQDDYSSEYYDLKRSISLIPNSLVALPKAGNRLDDYFKEFLWEQIGTKSSANPFEYAEMERLKRDLKEKFCLQGQLHNELILGHTISVTKQTLKKFNLFKDFESDFLEALKKSFSALVAADQDSQQWRIGNSFINHEADRAVVHVILTGGSSRFPIIKEFFNQKIHAGILGIETLFHGRKRDVEFIICEPSVQKLNNQTLVKHYQQLATVFGAGHVDMHLGRINL